MIGGFHYIYLESIFDRQLAISNCSRRELRLLSERDVTAGDSCAGFILMFKCFIMDFKKTDYVQSGDNKGIYRSKGDCCGRSSNFTGT